MKAVTWHGSVTSASKRGKGAALPGYTKLYGQVPGPFHCPEWTPGSGQERGPYVLWSSTFPAASWTKCVTRFRRAIVRPAETASLRCEEVFEARTPPSIRFFHSPSS